MFPLDVVTIRLFFRLLLGLLLLSVALSKLVRPRQFQQNIEDYNWCLTLLKQSYNSQ